MNYRLQDLIDISLFQTLQDKLDQIYSFPSAIIDNEGNVLTATAWQDICTKFHRVHPECEKECRASDLYILEHLGEAKPAVTYRCPHGLVDNATPIVIGGQHLGNYFTGQFFLEPPDPEFFRRQARRFGFDEAAYLAAVAKVPVWSEAKLHQYLDFIKGFVEILAGIGQQQLMEREARRLMNEQGFGQQAAGLLARQIIDSADEGIIVYGPDLRYRVWNPYMERLSGLPAGDVLGRHPLDLFPFLAGTGVLERVARALKGEKQPALEFRFTTPSKRTGWSSDTTVPLYAENGAIIGAIASVRDITERRRTEAELARVQAWHEGEQAVRLAIASMTKPEHLALVVGEIHRQLPRQGVSRYTDLSLQILNSDASDFYSLGPGHDPSRRHPLWTCGTAWSSRKGNSTRHPWVAEVARSQKAIYQPSLPSGRYMREGMSVLDVPFSHGTLAISCAESNAFNEQDVTILSQVASIISDGFRRFLDLVEQRRAERIALANLAVERVRNVVLQMASEADWVQVIQRVKDELRLLLPLSACSVCIVDREAGSTTFYLPDKSPDREISVYHRTFAAIERAVDSGEPVIRRTAEDLRRWGDSYGAQEVGALIDVPFEVGTLGVLTPSGYDLFEDDIEMLLRFSQVLSEAHRRLLEIRWRSQAEAELTEQRVRAVQADRLHALGEMASGMAHELNQPLNGIRTFAESTVIAAAKGWQITLDEMVQSQKDIMDQVDRMTAIIDHMRVFARDPGDQPNQRFSLNDAVSGAVRLLGAQLRVHGIGIEQALDDALPPCVGSLNELEQVVINLLSNARDALDEHLQRQRAGDPAVSAAWKPGITIRTGAADQAVELRVEDNGNGIPPDVAQRIFDPFYTTKNVGKGTGLGLAIVRGIVDRHKGTIDVDNRPGERVTFIVKLPTATSDARG